MADLLKQDFPRCFSHRAINIILGKSVRFILFFHILAIFQFLGKLKKVKLGFLFFVLRHLQAGTTPSYFNKERLQRKCFLVKFAKFLRTPFFIEHLQWLLLTAVKIYNIYIINIYILIKYQITCCYKKIALLKYNDNANINKATFH